MGRGRGMAGETRRARVVGSLVVATVITSTMPHCSVYCVKSTTSLSNARMSTKAFPKGTFLRCL